MKIVVTNNSELSFVGYEVVKSLHDLQIMTKDITEIDALILNRFDDTDFNAGIYLTQLWRKTKIKVILYINENPSDTIRLLLKGVNGFYYEDSFYLEDEDELNVLVEECTELEEDTGLAVVNSAIEVVETFIEDFAAGDTKVNTPIYLDNVRSAITQLAEISHQDKQDLANMSISLEQTFASAIDTLEKMKLNRKQLQDQLKTLENSQMTGGGKGLSNSMTFFPQYKYIGVTKVVFIKEYIPCLYLTSFMLGFADFLHANFNKRVKTIIITQKGADIQKRYNRYTFISQESMGVSSLYDKDILIVNEPKKEVLKEIFSKQVDVFLVIDRTYNQDDIVCGQVSRLCAAVGKRAQETFNFQNNTCIYPIDAYENELLHIPKFKQYPAELDARKAAYSNNMQDMFKTLMQKANIQSK